MQLNRDAIKALLLVAGKSDIRDYLNGIYFDSRQGDTVAVATDGSHLLAIKLGGQLAVNGLLRRADAELLVKAMDRYASVAPAADNSITCGKLTFALEPVERPLDCRRVVPANCNGMVAQFKPEYIANFGKASALLGNKYRGGIHVHHNGVSASVIDLNCEDAIGVLMPYRSHLDADDAHTSPEWVTGSPSLSVVREEEKLAA